MDPPPYPFITAVTSAYNSGQSRAVCFTGNIGDLFHLHEQNEFVSLGEFLDAKWNVPGFILIRAELNGPIRFLNDRQKELVKEAWVILKTGKTSADLDIERMQKRNLPNPGDEFEANLKKAVSNPTMALELLRQICLCARTDFPGNPLRKKNQRLVILVESVHMFAPAGEIARLSLHDRQRVAILKDWLSDPGFNNADDLVILMTESITEVSREITRLPQLLEIEVDSPSTEHRLDYIKWFVEQSAHPLKLWGTPQELAELSAGLSLGALSQLLKMAIHTETEIKPADVVKKVQEYVESLLGQGVVEFLRPEHTLKDVVGNKRLKEIIENEIIPAVKSADPEDAMPGVAVPGPIGAGKTYIFEAVAGECGIPVIVLKNLRSKWFGETDRIFERLRRVIFSLHKVLIFVDEADTMFGGVGANTHDTERRLTGKVQAMMSDNRLLGRVTWFLMTARIHLLSPDIRRPGRVEVILPVLDPEGEDRTDFLRWVLEPIDGDHEITELDKATKGFSAAGFAALRRAIKKKKRLESDLGLGGAVAIAKNYQPPNIGEARRLQELHALVNCTDVRLLKDNSTTTRNDWFEEIRKLESRGIK